MEFYADEAARVFGETIPANVPGRRLYAEPEPLGVAAAVCPEAAAEVSGGAGSSAAPLVAGVVLFAA